MVQSLFNNFETVNKNKVRLCTNVTNTTFNIDARIGTDNGSFGKWLAISDDAFGGHKMSSQFFVGGM